MSPDLPRLAVYLCLVSVCFVKASRETARPVRLSLLAVGILGILLAVTGELSAGGQLANFGRDQARDAGWYGDRRTVQGIGVVILLAATAVFGWAAMRVVATRAPELRAVALATGLLVGFIAVRVLSFHYIDVWLHARIETLGMDQGQAGELLLVLALAVVVARVQGPERSVGPQFNGA